MPVWVMAHMTCQCVLDRTSMHAHICPEERGAGRVALAAPRPTTQLRTEVFTHVYGGPTGFGTDLGDVPLGTIVVGVGLLPCRTTGFSIGRRRQYTALWWVASSYHLPIQFQDVRLKQRLDHFDQDREEVRRRVLQTLSDTYLPHVIYSHLIG